MKLTLGTNIAAMKAQRQLSNGSNDLSAVFERLASGQRINRASDDAAGLAIADSLNADARVYTQGVRNLNDGISVLNIADGALQELTNITFRLTELAGQAANGTLGAAQRASLDEEAQALKAEYFRIAKSTEFNGRKLFEGDYGVLSLQAGYGTSGSISDGLGGAISDETYSQGAAVSTNSELRQLISGDFNGDGHLDVVAEDYISDVLRISFGTGNGSFSSTISFATNANPFSIASGDIDNDGDLDLIVSSSGNTLELFSNNGDGSFHLAASISPSFTALDLALGDFNGDGNIDIASSENGAGTATILLGNGNFNFTVSQTLAISSVAGVGIDFIDTGDVNRDGISDIVIANYGVDNVQIFIGRGDGTFVDNGTVAAGDAPRLVLGDFNGDGVDDIATANYNDSTVGILLGVGDGTFGTMVTYSLGAPSLSIDSADFNGDGNLDILVTDFSGQQIEILLGNGDGTLSEGQSYSTGIDTNVIAIGDYNEDGVYDIVAGGWATFQSKVLIAGTTDGVAPLLDFSLNTIVEAKQALSQFQQKLSQLSEQRGQIGAFQSRIGVATNVLSASIENFKAAESRIRDADIAKESAELVRLQILQQASAAVLGQANLQPQLVLKLLGGNG